MIPVRTNEFGIIGAEDLRRVTIELGSVMKRLQTGYRVNSASEDVGALVQTNILTRALATLQLATEQVTKGRSILTKIEDTVKKIYDILAQMKQNAERAVLSTDSQEISTLQESSDQLYVEIRKIARSTVFQKMQLIRGGLGNRMIAPVTLGGSGITLTRSNFDVSGINLAGFAANVSSDVSVPNLVTVSPLMWTNAVDYGDQVSIDFSVGGGIATAVLYVGGTQVFTEAIRINFTGAQVLDFVNLGFRVYVEDINFGQGVSFSDIITIQREQYRVFRGVNVNTEMDYVHFDIPNLEPENLLGSLSLGGGTMFTFDLREAPETAVTQIEQAIEYIENVRARVGAIIHMLETADMQVQDQRIIAQVQRSAIIDTKFDEDALQLTSIQVVQQSANAMVAISRLTPQLVLQLLGG